MKKSLEFNLAPVAPYNFELTVRKWAGWYWLTPFEVYEKGTLWTGTRLNSRPLGLKLKSLGTVEKPKIEIQVIGQPLSKKQQRSLVKFLKDALAVDQNLSEFYALCEKYPVLRQVKKDLYGMHTATDPNLFNGAVLSITLQMAPTKRSLKMLYDLFENYGEKLRFDGKEVILWAMAESLNAVSEEELREKCKLGYRAKFIKAIAADYCAGRFPKREDLLALTPEEAKKELIKLKGIGDYSADIITPHPGFPLDIWSVKIFSKLLKIKMTKPAREMIPIIKEWAKREWGKHRGTAFTYILNDLDNLKRKFKVDIGGTVADKE